MTQVSAPLANSGHPLVARLTSLRGRVRMVLALSGMGIAITAGVGILFLFMLADYLIHIPAGLRIFMLLAWIAGMGVLIWRRLLSPLSTRLTDQFLASRVENVNAGLSDELMSAVHFIHTGAASTNALAALHIDQVAAKTANLSFEEAVDFRNAGKSLGIAFLVMLIVSVVGMANPYLANVAFHRWLTTAPLAWPHASRVAFDWSQNEYPKDANGVPKVLPQNEGLIVRAIVDQGPQTTVRLYSWSDKEGVDQNSDPMQEQPNDSTPGKRVFESTLKPTGNQLNLRITAGDDREQDPIHITLAPRPVVTELMGSITPPAYVKNPKDPTRRAAPVEVDLLSQKGHAVEGAAVKLHVRSTKPFLLNDKHEPDIRLIDTDNPQAEDVLASGNRILLEPNVAEINFTATKTFHARIEMRDADSFTNNIRGTIIMEVVPDAMPTIVITEPRGAVERAPNGLVDLAMEAGDDWGLDQLKLRADRFDTKSADDHLVELPLPWETRTTDAAVGTAKGTAKFSWELASLNLKPGDRISFYGMVQDNYEVDGQRHEWVKSVPLTLQIMSTEEILVIARNNLQEISKRINLLRQEQELTRNATAAIQKSVAASGVTTAAQKAKLSDLAQQENQQSAVANAIQDRAAQVADDLRQNKMAEGELGKIAQEVAAGMQNVGQDNMPKAAADLNKAQDSAGNAPAGDTSPKSKADAQQAAGSMASAGAQQDQALDTMDQLLKDLSAASDVAALKSQIASLLDRQQKIDQQTKEVGKQVSPGKNPADLPKDQQAKLADTSKKQADLQNDTADTLNSMAKTAEQLAQSDPSAAQSVKSAAAAGQQANVTKNQGSASASIGQNQTGDAQGPQQAAEAGLQNMLDELEKNDRRQLEQLARDLQALVDEAKKIRADEDQLNKDTVTAGAGAASGPMQKLGDRQDTLNQNTMVLEKKAQNTQRARAAVPDIHDASLAMGTGAEKLYGSKQPESLEPEKAAITALDAAIKKLSEQAQKAADDVKDKDLAQFIKDYEGIQKDQQAIKTTTDQMETRRLATVDKEVDYLDSKKLPEVAKTQGGLMDRLKALSTDPKLRDYEVVVWMNGQVAELMTTSKDRLSKAQLGSQTASVQEGAIDRLQLIIDALKEEKNNKDPFEGGGGGGGGGGGKPPLVPPVAQLKLLKAMQTIVNGETTSVNRSLMTAAADADKNQFQTQAEKLGEKQGEIRNLADKLIQSLSGGGPPPAPAPGGAPVPPGRGGGPGGGQPGPGGGPPVPPAPQ